MLVDLAHASKPLIDDVLAIAKRPVLVSHTGVAGTCKGPRNLSDEHLQRIAANGGLIGIGYWDAAVCETSVGAIVRAIRYSADKIGVEHVALGSDFNGTVHTPFDTTGLAQITEGLQRAGFSQADIAKIMGGNVQRLLLATLPE
jgi:microsomal dipeptidase-like Zn-dependent dipeptidase